jgi:hypothetical protein
MAIRGTSQMTPWDSDWAGGTEGADFRLPAAGVNGGFLNDGYP